MKGFLKKIPLGISMILLVLGLSTISVNAWGNCGGSPCGCTASNSESGRNESCAQGNDCWFGGVGSACRGHDWDTANKQYVDSWQSAYQAASCTGNGYKTTTTKYLVDCKKCDATYYITESNTETLYGGHNVTGWIDYSGTQHYKYCTNGCGTKTEYQNHSWRNGGMIQQGDGYKHNICDICGRHDKYANVLNLTLNANGGSFNGATYINYNLKYGDKINLASYQPSRDGYTLAGWKIVVDINDTAGTSTSYQVDLLKTGNYTPQEIYNAILNGNCSATLYAQWTKTITYDVYFLTASGSKTDAKFTVVFQNFATEASVSKFTDGETYTTDVVGTVANGTAKKFNKTNDLISISNFSSGTVSKNNCSDWKATGLSTSSLSYATDKKTVNIPVSINDKYNGGTLNYYCSYERTPVITLIDYATNEIKTRTITGSVIKNGKEYKTAGMNYQGTVDRKPVFTFEPEHTMVYGEKLSSGAVKNETWTSTGWSRDTLAKNKSYTSGTNVPMGTNYVAQQSKMASYGDYTYYGNYAKTVTLTCDPNGGVITNKMAVYSRSVNNVISYTRYANINSKVTTTNQTYTLASATYKGENGLDRYTQGAWVYGSGQINTDFYSKVVGTNKNDLSGEFIFTPLVSETVYASWTNQTAQTSYEPKVTVTKKAEWNNPNSDDSSVDFDADGDIDIDGIVKVTLTVKVDNKSGSGLVNFSVLDYFDTEIWEYATAYGYKCSKGSLSGLYGANVGNLKWEIASGNANKITSDATYTCTYYLKLKEKYWTTTPDGEMVTDETTYYINPIEDLTKYKATIKSDGTLNYSSDYYSTNEGQKAYTYASYTIVYNNGTKLDGTQRYVPYSTSASVVLMDHIHWKPQVEQVSISSKKNNIYKNIDASYKNTYFVQYDTHSSDSSNSLFNITINSSIMRSYQYYQITNNLFDIKTAGKIEQVYNNSIGINGSSSAISKITTNSDLDSLNGYKAGTLLNLSSAKNLHTAVNTGGLQYIYGALTSQNTMYATNQDGLKLSIYPFVRTTCTIDNKIFETTRNTTELKNKRLDLVIDATNPIITADSRIRTESESGQQWTASDGYVDINLVNNKTNPEAKTQTLTFNFEDKVSGVNDPRITGDWINATKDNIQVTLVNKDTGKILFDYSKDSYSGNAIIKATYDTTGGMNKTGSVTVTLNPNNEDLLGHLQLTIKVIDNVSNWTEKTYDIYSFCLTGNVNVVDTLPSASERNEAEIWNGEQGKIQISANGWVDRVSVDFEYSLVEASKKELIKRNNITGDEYKINGDYPLDDSNLTGDGTKLYYYLPTQYLKCKWGYVNGELGGLPLSLAKLSTVEYTLNHDILNTHLNELIANYIAKETGGHVENVNGSNYAIYGNTLYTYPIYKGDTVDSYVDAYTFDGSIIIDEMPYPQYVIINGSQYATITYTETDDGYVASIEEQTIITSNWVKVGDEYYKPLVHYFYMPTYAEVRNGENANDHYIVQLTAYKDSDTDFVHTVSIQLTMTNDNYGGSLKDLQTNIKDN